MRYSAIQSVLFASCLSATLSGCAHPHYVAVRADEAPAAESAYWYGYFGIEDRRLYGGSATVSFLFECADGERYLIPFSSTKPLQMIKVAPSSCGLREIGWKIYNEHQIAPPPGMKKITPFAHGQAYYLGAFKLVIEPVEPSYGVVRAATAHFMMGEDGYADVTRAIHGMYPRFSDIPTTSRRIGTSSYRVPLY